MPFRWKEKGLEPYVSGVRFPNSALCPGQPAGLLSSAQRGGRHCVTPSGLMLTLVNLVDSKGLEPLSTGCKPVALPLSYVPEIVKTTLGLAERPAPVPRKEHPMCQRDHYIIIHFGKYLLLGRECKRAQPFLIAPLAFGALSGPATYPIATEPRRPEQRPSRSGRSGAQLLTRIISPFIIAVKC